MRVLISAYACEPGKGSEPNVGWEIACAMAQRHDVWVLTRANNRDAVERALGAETFTDARPRFVYYDLPAWARWWKRGSRGVRLYYYLWQLGAYPKARRIHRAMRFDVVHHVTFVKYWAPSLGARLRAPFVWGPLGGGETTPAPFRSGLGVRGRLYERLRDVARALGELDPLVRFTARRSSVAIAATADTAARVERIGAARVRVMSQVGLSKAQLAQLGAYPPPGPGPARFVSVGNLLHLKGFHLGLDAFARAALPGCEYWIVGHGPERRRLERRAARLGIADRVRFLGRLTREETMRAIADCHVLVHPSLHDSGGFVCAEAMGVGRPVICLDIGGPAEQVRGDTGFVISTESPAACVSGLAAAMERLARSAEERTRMGSAGRRRVCEVFGWERKADLIDAAYREASSPTRCVRVA